MFGVAVPRLLCARIIVRVTRLVQTTSGQAPRDARAEVPQCDESRPARRYNLRLSSVSPIRQLIPCGYCAVPSNCGVDLNGPHCPVMAASLVFASRADISAGVRGRTFSRLRLLDRESPYVHSR
jgi:hypothetical protein